MASVRITQFSGLMPEVNARLMPPTNAQIAHNCLLTDGTLRPYAAWVAVGQGGAAEPVSLAYDARGNGRAIVYPMYDAVTVDGAPFAEATVGLDANNDNNVFRFVTGSDANGERTGIPGAPFSGSVTYTRAYDSIKPVNRIYATARVRKRGGRTEVGPLALLPNQLPTDIVYEGDLVQVDINATVEDGCEYVRLYRSVTGLDTGQAITNDLDTNWHLVAEMFVTGSTLTYIDGASATALPLDVYHGNQFHGLPFHGQHFGLTEGGWFVAVSPDGDIAVSERYLHHAWPSENVFKVPGKTTDVAVHMDNVYIGTELRPYVLALAQGDKALQGAVVPYGEHMPCLPGSMTPSATGSMYASGHGIVSLSREGMQVLTRDICNAGDVLSRRDEYDNYGTFLGTAEASVRKTSHGRYFAGSYYGFCDPVVVMVGE